jgi:acyl phosphate:glycerol-3-phosphate acyltransferase
MNAIHIALALVSAYLIGSFPSAYIVGKLSKGLDIRQVGSRNMGAMNTFYKVGFWWGILVLALDIGKGALAIGVAIWLGTHLYVQMGAGVAAVIGHNLPVFLKFKGGKGGAACIGILMVLMPWGVPMYLGLFLLLLAITRFPTLSYSLAFLGFPFLGAFLYHSIALAVYSIIVILLPGARYIGRIREMYRKAGGSWKHVLMRKGLKDRL